VIRIARKKCSPQIVRHAVLFRYRADFGLLCKMAVSDIEKEFDKDFYTRQLLAGMRKHYKSLIRISMPTGRKVIMTCMCINYPVTAKVMQIGSKLFKHKLLARC